MPDTIPGANTFDLGPWSRWTFQQYSWTGRVPGITGEVDLNVFSGDPGQLQKYVLPPLTHPLASPRATPAVAVRGTSIDLSAEVVSSRARSLMLGATIYPAGLSTSGTSDPPRDRAINLPEGSATARRPFALPAGLAPGEYDLVMALWVDLDASGTILRLRFPRWADRTDIVYALQQAAHPAPENWATLAAAAGGEPFSHPRISESGTSPVQVTVEIPVDQTTPSFLRVQVTKL